MYRIDNDTAVPALPVPAAVGPNPNHYFTKGNPGSGIPATIVDDDWANAVQEEICAVIVAAGISLNKTNRAQLLAALRATGVFQTAAQFDSSSKAATTEFVQRALGNHSSADFLAVSTVLTAADVGKFYSLGSASPFTITLPARSALPSGAAYTFRNSGASVVTIARTGADTFTIGQVSQTSVAIPPGSEMTITADINTAIWNVSGQGTLRFDSQFLASLSGNGYQKFPSGLIVQWGQATASGAAPVTVTFPIAFPSVVVNIQALALAAAAQFANTGTPTLTNFPLSAWNEAGVRTPNGCYWFAIGY